MQHGDARSQAKRLSGSGGRIHTISEACSPDPRQLKHSPCTIGTLSAPLSMNLYAFFRNVVLRYLSQEALTHAQVTAFNASLKVIKQGYRNHFPIDYSDETTRLAYMISFAPRHAIIWREYVAKSAPTFTQFPLSMNSIGTGCGSEIIGVLEGLRILGHSGDSNWKCLDREPTWTPLLKAEIE